MQKHFKKLGIVASVLALGAIVSSTTLALPPQANTHAQSATVTHNVNQGSSHGLSTTNQNTNNSSQQSGGQVNAQTHLAVGQLKACQNRESAVNNIMSRIDTRAQNQINLFSTIATRVENFYVKQGNTLANYNQLVLAVNTAKSNAEADFGTLSSGSTFSCTANNPKGVVNAFQGYLKTEISDLQTFRTSVKNLIVGVASANGTTVSTSNQSQTGSTKGAN